MSQELLNRIANIEKAIQTGTFRGPGGAGLLNAEQSKTFFKMAFEKTVFGGLQRHEMRKATTGEIDKIAIGGRLLRKKAEGTDDGYRAGVSSSKVEYATQAVRLPWEITEDALRRNIEGERLEDIIMGYMTEQTGLDIEDLHFNGDKNAKDTDGTTPHPFLSINDGWIKKIKTGTGAHIVDHSAVGGTGFDKKHFFAASRAMPNKYKGSGLKWIMSPTRKEIWMEYLANRTQNSSDAAILGGGDLVNQPLGYGIVTPPSFPDDLIILTNPKNFIVVNTYDMRIRKDAASKDAIMKDERYYVIHFDDDAIVQELDAVVMLTGLPEILDV